MGNQKLVFLAMPVYRTMDVFTAQSLIKVVASQMQDQEIGISLKMHIGECPIGRARNDLSMDFLKSDCTHMLFVDSDIIFSYEQIKKMLDSDEDIVGGFYCKKQEGDVAPVCNTLTQTDKPDHRGLVKVKYMGTGFLMISRRVFEVMIQKMGEDLAYIDDGDGKTTKYDFWRMGVEKDCVTGVKRWLSEDWQFCQFAIQCGFTVWADASVLLQHSGQAIYPLSYQIHQLYTPEQISRMNLTVLPYKKVTEEAGPVVASPRQPAPLESEATCV